MQLLPKFKLNCQNFKVALNLGIQVTVAENVNETPFFRLLSNRRPTKSNSSLNENNDNKTSD